MQPPVSALYPPSSPVVQEYWRRYRGPGLPLAPAQGGDVIQSGGRDGLLLLGAVVVLAFLLR